VAQALLPAAERQQELRSWEALIRASDAMNRFVQKQLRKNSWDGAVSFVRAMSLAHQVIPHTDIATLPS